MEAIDRLQARFECLGGLVVRVRPLLVPLVLLAAIACTAALFTLEPGLDLGVASALYKGQGTFVAQTSAGEAVRRGVYWVPAIIAAAITALYLVKRLGLVGVWAPSGSGVLVALLSFAIGPGLLVNVALKNHSHRPRPSQTIGFGGDEPFRPFYRFDGACVRNCSFVSGEGSAAFWTVVPALLVPPPVRIPAVAAALVFGSGVAGLRMAFGGHYLSDTIFAALFTWLTSWLVWFVLMRSGTVDGPPRVFLALGGADRRSRI